MSVLEFGQGKQQLETTLLVSNGPDGGLNCQLYEGDAAIPPDTVLVSSFKTWLTAPSVARGFLTADNRVVSITGERACEEFFKLLFSRLEKQGRAITKRTRFVIAEPAYGTAERTVYQSVVRKAVQAAIGREAVIDFFREPDAVFSYFRITPRAKQLKASQNVLIVDAGGGTCNLSVVTLTAAGELWARQLAVPVSADAPQAGGSTVDRSIILRALGASPHKAILTSKDPAITVARDRWIESQLRSIERLKVSASLKGKANTELKLEPSLVGGGASLKLSIEANRLKAESQTLWNGKRVGSQLTAVLSQLHERLSRTAGRKGLDPDHRKLVSLIILTGGTSRLPGFRDCLDDFFNGLDVPVAQLTEDASLAVVRGLRQSYLELSGHQNPPAGEAPVPTATAFLPTLEEDLALYWLLDRGGERAGLVYEARNGPHPYLRGDVPELRTAVPEPPPVSKVKKKGPVQYRGQVCTVSDEHATALVPSPNRLNMLKDRVQIPQEVQEIGVRTRITMEEGHEPQLVLDFRVGDRVIEQWPLPYLGQPRGGASEEGDRNDVLFIDFGTSATRIIDLRAEARPVLKKLPEFRDLFPSAPQPGPVVAVTVGPESQRALEPQKAPEVSELQGVSELQEAPELEVSVPPPPVAASAPPPIAPRFKHRARARFSGDERSFVDYLQEYCKDSGLVVEDGLIKNLYLCLKVRPMVVLAGPPGVGKSSVATRFAEAMGSSFEPGQDSLRIAVEANWTDGRYLFWQNHGAGRQDPTRFLQLLRQLESGQAERPHHVLLDEMNLAHVEYYFAQFLSAFEADGVVTVPGASLDQSELRLPHRTRPSELAFFGTINIDETTHVLSDKVLDRCNLIEVRMTSFPTLFAESQPKTELGITVEQLRSWRDVPKGTDLAPPALKAIVTALATETPPSDTASARTHGRGIHLGYRLVRDIGLYCHFAAKLGVDEKTALDWQVCQRILPRIRGDARLGHALKQLDDELMKQELPRSRQRLQRLLRDLEDGFVSFWA